MNIKGNRFSLSHFSFPTKMKTFKGGGVFREVEHESQTINIWVA